MGPSFFLSFGLGTEHWKQGRPTPIVPPFLLIVTRPGLSLLGLSPLSPHFALFVLFLSFSIMHSFKKKEY